MTPQDGLFTSESVSAGHPDKVCDLISDTVLDAFLTLDPGARVACETIAADGKILVAGEFLTRDPAHFQEVQRQVPELVRRALRSVGYTTDERDMNPDTCEIEVRFNQQSSEISHAIEGGAVDLLGPVGPAAAGDQGQMFGYATDESPDLMPRAWSIANDLIARGQTLRLAGGSPLLGDGKAQATVRYLNGRPATVEIIVLSWQHESSETLSDIRDYLARNVVQSVLPNSNPARGPKLLLNPAGSWNIGGPKGDTGLTGRKIVVDTYGGACPNGGGAFSGKDPSKVDRSGAYAARYIARHVVSARLARRCTVQLAYAIGSPTPVSLGINLHGTGAIAEDVLAAAISSVFDLTPNGVITELELQRPIFASTSSLGHFGRHRDVTKHLWETNPRLDELANAVGTEIRRRSQRQPPPGTLHTRPRDPVHDARQKRRAPTGGEEGSQDRESVDQRQKRICGAIAGKGVPRPRQWDLLWRILERYPDARGERPPMPLILRAHSAPSERKLARLEEQIRWAADHGALDRVEDFFQKLSSEDWEDA